MHKTSNMSVLTGMDESGEIVGGGESLLHEPASALSPVVDFEDTSGEVDEDKYGEVIERADGASKSPLTEFNMDGRPRGFSFTSSTSPLSPTISPGSANPSMGQEFPCSIERPPLADILQLLTVLYTSSSEGTTDHCLRGDSVSSMSTDGSAIHFCLGWW